MSGNCQPQIPEPSIRERRHIVQEELHLLIPPSLQAAKSAVPVRRLLSLLSGKARDGRAMKGGGERERQNNEGEEEREEKMKQE